MHEDRPSGAGVRFTNKPCGRQEQDCGTVSVFAEYLTYEAKGTPLDNMVSGFLSRGWTKTDESMIRRKGNEWIRAALSRSEDKKPREMIILTLSSRLNTPAIQYWIIAEFSPRERQNWLREIERLLDGWRYRDPC